MGSNSFIFLINILFYVITFHSSIIGVTCTSCHETEIEANTLLGFDLSCKENVTTIYFPSYGDLVVKSISYETKKIDLLDPENCVHRVFLNLNLSLTPFHYYYVLKNYTYLNCSTNLVSPTFMEVPCLSGSSYHVYTVDPEILVPDSCKKVKTVEIPFEYSPYLSDNRLGLRFSWELSESEDREARNHKSDSHKAQNDTDGLGFFSGYGIVFYMMAMLIFISICIKGFKRNFHERKEELLQSLEHF